MNFPPALSTLLKTIQKSAQKRKVKLYIVGGYLRDILLGRAKDNLDIDFAVQKNAISFGRQLKKQIHAGFVVLDKERGCCRLVKRVNDKTYTFDFTDFRGSSLKDDLRQRDFTINSFAASLEDFLKAGQLSGCLIDPYQGKQDLQRKIIRSVSKKSFDDDPLRILRAFSLSATFGFKINAVTLKQIKAKKEKLAKVSFERIRDELFKIFASSDADKFLETLDKLKILKIIIPEIEVMRGVKQGPYHHLDVWKHTLEAVKQLEGVLREFGKREEVRSYLEEALSAERSRYMLLKLGALLHDIGKPKSMRHKDGKLIFHGHERIGVDFTRAIARRLKLSNDELAALEKIVFLHLRPGYLADNEDLTPRARFRFFRDAGKEAVSILLLSIGDQRATKGRLTTADSRSRQEQTAGSLIREYFRKSKEKKLVRLINGDDLIKELKLAPSPLIGEILKETEELQAIGKLKTKKEALGFAVKFLKNKKG